MKDSRIYFVAATVLSFVLFVLPALSVLGPNASEFGLSILRMMWPFCVLFVAGTLFAFLIARASSFSPVVLSLYLCISVAGLVTSQIFIEQLFVVDGGIHDYQPPIVRAIIEGGLLVAIFVGGFALRKVIHDNRRFVTSVIALWAIAAALVPATSYRSHERPEDNLQALSQLSRKLNVLHVMLDSMQPDAFIKILEREESLRREFEGFVLYGEHAGYSNWTSFSLPAILAGRLYFEDHHESRDANELINRWMTQDSLMARLADRGFAVSAVQPGVLFCEGAKFSCTTHQANAEALEKAASNAEPSSRATATNAFLTGDHALLANLALLRLTPTVAKGVVYNRGRLLFPGWGKISLTPAQNVTLSRELAAFLAGNFRVSSDIPVYKFIHFFPPHRPFVLDDRCDVRRDAIATGGAEETWENYLEQTGCAVRLATALIRKLKELGVYDNTIIILQGDTGLGMVPGSGKGGSEQSVSKLSRYTSSQLVAYARPAFAIKPIGRQGPLTRTDERTHHRDIIPLVMAAIADAENARSAGTPPKIEISSAPRPFVVSDALRPDVRQVSPFELFEIDGPIGNFERWTNKGVFSAPGVLAKPMRPIDELAIDIRPKGDVAVGDRITLSAKVNGGEPEKLYLFFYRIEDGRFGVIQNWSEKNEAEWTVRDGQRYPCVAELLVAVRNKGANEDASKTVEKNLPVLGRRCSAPGVLAQEPIKDLVADVSQRSDLAVGDKITLSAKASGGEAEKLYLFFYRIEGGKFGVIQNWSEKSEAEWTVDHGHRNPCVAELLVAARNKGSNKNASKTVEVDLPVKGPKCSTR